MTARGMASRRRQLLHQVGFVAAGTTGAVALALLSFGLLVVPWAS